MKNGFFAVTIVILLIAFAGMMRVKTDVQTMDAERKHLVELRAELRETKRVQEAEWALMASPDRLQTIASYAGKTYMPGTAMAMEPLMPPVAMQPTPTVVTSQTTP